MRPPSGDDRDLGSVQGWQREGGLHRQDMASYAGIQRGAKGQEAEDGGRQVREMSRWTVLCSGRGVGDQVQEKGATTSSATDGASCRIEGRKKGSRKLVETVGARGLE